MGADRTIEIILPPGFWMRRDEILPRGEAFLKGSYLYDVSGVDPTFWSNTSNCFYAMTNFTWIVTPHYLDFFSTAGPSPWEKF